MITQVDIYSNIKVMKGVLTLDGEKKIAAAKPGLYDIWKTDKGGFVCWDVARQKSWNTIYFIIR